MNKARIPEQIDEYEVQRILGRGGMGTVYLCHDAKLKRPVALKVLTLKNDVQEDAIRRLRFLREAMITAQLQHPGIPPVYEVRQSSPDPGDPHGIPGAYYVMKPIEGRSLQEILDRLRAGEAAAAETYDLFRRIEILRDVCQTVQYAHNHGFLHRDLKPSNIFVGDWGGVYILDWGLAKSLNDAPREEAAPGGAPALDTEVALQETAVLSAHPFPAAATAAVDFDEPLDAQVDLTLDGDVIGTPAYMPPEQADSSVGEVGRQADIYALGVILYEMLTLELPVEGETLREVVDLKNRGDIVAPEVRAPQRDIPPELSAITLQATAPLPENRFSSVDELTRALNIWLEGKSQYRLSHRVTVQREDLLTLPEAGRDGWQVADGVIRTHAQAAAATSYLLFRREFPGDVRFTLNVTAWPQDAEGWISEFGLVLSAGLPESFEGFLDAYELRLGASRNTRAYLMRNGVEVAANDEVACEPGKRYALSLESTEKEIRVLLNRRTILAFQDTDPLPGLHLGFVHYGPGITYSNIKIYNRGQQTMVRSIEIPEALMQEGCFEAAEKRFLSIARAHANRFEGAWARYRAGVAAFRRAGDRARALWLWEPLRQGPFAIFELLGRATLELEADHPLAAARIIDTMLREHPQATHLDPVADIVFHQTQQLFRLHERTPEQWEILDAWVRLALLLSLKVESKRPLAPSLLWRWLVSSEAVPPGRLRDCVAFLRQFFGAPAGPFAEVLMREGPLVTVLRRCFGMSEHAYLMERMMRLLLHQEDNLGHLQTLARFYLHGGQEEMAERIYRRIFDYGRRIEAQIPPGAVPMLGGLDWLRGRNEEAVTALRILRHQSQEWGRFDADLLLGLEAYGRDDRHAATRHWRQVRDRSEAAIWNRQLVARGLMGELPPDPEKAGVPNRSDHRLLYCLFLGYRFFLDWKREGAEEAKRIASGLLQRVLELRRPCYDVYSATATFAAIPLRAMGEASGESVRLQSVDEEELTWIRDLLQTATES